MKKNKAGRQRGSGTARPTLHFSDRLYKSLLWDGAEYRAPFLNWMFGTQYPRSESIILGANVGAADRDMRERVADGQLCVQTPDGLYRYLVECNTAWASDLDVRACGYARSHARIDVVSSKGAHNTAVLSMPQVGILLLRPSTAAPDNVLYSIKVNSTVEEISVPVRQLGKLTPKEIENWDLALLVPLYLAKYGRRLRKEPPPRLMDAIIGECTALYRYLRNLYDQEQMNAAQFSLWRDYCIRAIDHYAEKTPELRKELHESMESIYIETPSSQLIQHGFSKGEAHGFSKGEAHGFSKGEAHGFSKGEAYGFSKGEAHGFSKGDAHGFSRAQRRMASRLIARGYDTGEIADLTGLTEQEIAEIRSGKTGPSSAE